MALPQAGVELVANGLSGFVTDMGRANTAVAEFGSKGAASGNLFARGFGEIVTGALRQVGAMAVNAMADAGKAVAGFLTESVDVAGDFEAGMLNFQAVAGKGVDTAGLEKFHDLFISLGRELPVSTSEVQQAAIEMVSGGIDPAIVAGGGLRQTLQFAAASGMSLADAAQTSAKFLAGWTSSAATTEEKVAFLSSSTDALTKAANASSTTVSELRLGLFNLQGSAQALHAPFDDMAASLAVLAPAFESSAQAGTAMNVFMTRLVPSTNPATDAMKALGIITKDNQNLFFDAQGSFKGMANAAQVLKDHLGGLSDEQKISYLHTLFGNDAMKVGNLLMQDGAAAINAMKAKMAEANGVSDTAALKQQGYNVALDNAKGSVEALKITVGEKLLPVLTSLLNNYVAPGINMLTSLADAVSGDTEAFNGLSGPLQGVATTMQAVGGFVGDLVERAQHAYNGFLLWQKGTVSLRTALDVLMPGLGSMAPVIEGITSVVQRVSSWIGTNLPTALQVASEFWTGTLEPALKTVYDVFDTQVIPIITNLAATVLPVLGSALQVAGGFFTNVLIPAGKLLWNAFTTLLLPVLSDVAVWLRDNVPPAVQTLADFLTKTLFPALKTVYDFADANLIPLLKVLGDVLSATVGKAVEALAALWENILWPALKKAGAWISDTLGPILKNFTSWLGDVTGGVEGITGAIRDAIKWLSDLADTIGKLSLPDWLTPGSPTPMEIGIRGIGDALKTEMNPQIDSLFQTLSVAPPASAQQLLAGGGSTTTIDNSRNLTMPVYTNNSPGAIQTSAAIALAVLP